MSVLTEQAYPGDWLKGEEDSLYSREQVTILAGEGELKTGTVLGKITASGKYTQLDLDASDGSQNAAGILLLDATAESGADKQAVAIVRHAIVNEDQLTWPVGATSPEKATALAALKALGIVAREGA
jgi:hypothetical protein